MSHVASNFLLGKCYPSTGILDIYFPWLEHEMIIRNLCLWDAGECKEALSTFPHMTMDGSLASHIAKRKSHCLHLLIRGEYAHQILCTDQIRVVAMVVGFSHYSPKLNTTKRQKYVNWLWLEHCEDQYCYLSPIWKNCSWAHSGCWGPQISHYVFAKPPPHHSVSLQPWTNSRQWGEHGAAYLWVNLMHQCSPDFEDHPNVHRESSLTLWGVSLKCLWRLWCSVPLFRMGGSGLCQNGSWQPGE